MSREHFVTKVSLPSSSNTAAQVTFPAPAGNNLAWHLTGVWASYEGGTPSGGAVKVYNSSSGSEGNRYGHIAVTSEGAAPLQAPIVIPPGNAMPLVLPAGGVGITGRLTATAYLKRVPKGGGS